MVSDLFISGAFKALLVDCSVSELDQMKLNRRFRNEGISFLTKTLPILAKDALNGVESGKLVLSPHFRKAKDDERPILLGEFFRLVFNEFGNVRYDNLDEHAGALAAIRQVCEYFYKADFPRDPAEDEDFILKFNQTDSNLLKELPFGSSLLSVAQQIVTVMFHGADIRVKRKYGPGVCSDALPHEKWGCSFVDSEATRNFPQFYTYGNSESAQRSRRMTHLSLFDREQSAKVILVPKDSRGPRVISCEPHTNQLLQMAVMNAMVDHLEKSSLTSGFVNFSSQEINRNLALEGSLTGGIATLDLKDASDRVRLDLVSFLFKRTSLISPLLASRTPITELPNGKRITLRKFAPMGSATCFPTMASVLWALAHAAITIRHKEPVFSTPVYVYGDDLIVPTRYMDCIIEALEICDLAINKSKSFSKSWFRESCGLDAYRGVIITPFKLRKPYSDEVPVLENIFNIVHHRNEIHESMPELGKWYETFCDIVLRKLHNSRKSIGFTSKPGVCAFLVSPYDKRLATSPAYYVHRSSDKINVDGSDWDTLDRSFDRIGSSVSEDISIVSRARKGKFKLRKLEDRHRRET